MNVRIMTCFDLFLISEINPAKYSTSIVTDNLTTVLKKELDNIKTTWIAPHIHEELKTDFSKLTCEQNILEVRFFLNMAVVENGYIFIKT